MQNYHTLVSNKASYKSDRSIIYTFFISALAVISIIAGGGTTGNLPSDLLVQMVSLPVLGLAVLRLCRMPIQDGAGLMLLGLVLVLPLLQLIPVPPDIWTRFAGRAVAVELYQTAGLALPPLPLSLDPEATRGMLLSLLPATALFLAIRQATTDERITVMSVVGLVGGFAALQGVSQALQGGGVVPWLEHLQHHTGVALGPFVNRNHFAALMYVLLPLSTAMALIFLRRPGPGRAFLLLGWGFLFFSAVLGLATSISRAGAILGVIGCLGVLLLIWTAQRQSQSQRWPLVIFSAILFCVLLFQQLQVIEIMQFRSSDSDLRGAMSQNTMAAISDFMPAGSGFGTFPTIYQMYENDIDIFDLRVNHAHNDFLELTLEGGAAAFALLLAFVIWLALRCWSIWKQPRGAGFGELSGLLLARGASIGVLLLLAHELVDYPLRTTTLMSLFGLLCGLVSVPVVTSARGRGGRSRSA